MDILPLVLAAIIAFAVTLYVLLDGFSLGVGILFPFAEDRAMRRTMMATVAPIWDGNQTWLVFGGTILFGAFPTAFAILLQAFYLPLIVMLLALVLRGSAFEFRAESNHVRYWDGLFAAGCWLAAYCQGMVLGAYVLGISDGFWHLWAPFTHFCAIAVVIAYALLGSLWLALKTRGALHERSMKQAMWLFPFALLCIAVASLWTPLAVPAIAERWFRWPNFLFLSPVPIFTLALAVVFCIAHARDRALQAFVIAAGLYLLTLAGLAVSLWPWIVPRTMTLWQAAAAPASQLFLLIGIALVLPWVLIYTAHAYYVFRGTVGEEDGY